MNPSNGCLATTLEFQDYVSELEDLILNVSGVRSSVR